MLKQLFLAVALVGALGQWVPAQDGEDTKPEIFSGPQAGEKLADLKVKGVYGEKAGKTWNLLESESEKAKLILFLHKRTRPAFGLARTLMPYVAKRDDDKLTGAVIWLTADPTETENWLGNVEKYFPKTKRMPVVYSPEGIEGPGAYGLNRNVSMTILVANKNRVTANFALVQPSLQADFPKIMKAVVQAAGGEIPKLSDLNRRAMRARKKPANSKRDAELTALLRRFVQKDARDEQVKKLAGKIEAHVKDNPQAQKQLGTVISRIQRANKLENYGTETAREFLRKWGKSYGPPKADDDKSSPDR